MRRERPRDLNARWAQWRTEAVEGATKEAVEGAAKEAVVDLWLSYARLETEKRQFKQATKVYESAVACPIAEHFSRVWIAFAGFWR